MDAEEALEELLTAPPDVHFSQGRYQTWGLDSDTLRWIADHVGDSSNTLETGCGVSSIVFALRARRHTIVSPTKWHQAAVRAWCAERGFSTDHVSFILDHSQYALPALPDEPLDLVLIDGAHAMPIPFLDWYYTALRLRVGGQVVIDDMHIPACALLCDFLASEDGRWRLSAEVGRARAFEKLSDELVPAEGWSGQRWPEGPDGRRRRWRGLAFPRRGKA